MVYDGRGGRDAPEEKRTVSAGCDVRRGGGAGRRFALCDPGGPHSHFPVYADDFPVRLCVGMAEVSLYHRIKRYIQREKFLTLRGLSFMVFPVAVILQSNSSKISSLAWHRFCEVIT